MNTYFQRAKEYVVDHKKEFITGSSVAGAIAIIFLGLALYSYNTSQPKIEYEPAVACNLLTLDEAKTLLGDATINAIAENPAQTGSITTSSCGYSDGKIDTANAIAIGIKVRTGINDKGIELNKTQFKNGTPTEDVEIVKDVGDSAYFNKANGQFSVLKDSTWVIISYGPAADAAANTVDDAVKLAKLVLN